MYNAVFKQPLLNIYHHCTYALWIVLYNPEILFIKLNTFPYHLLSASVMSAPPAIAMAKQFWSGNNKSKAHDDEVDNIQKG